MKTHPPFPQRLKQQILQQAQASPEQEICGLIAGDGTRFTAVYPVRNVAENPSGNFLLDAEEQITAMRDMRARGLELMGIYHSHPYTVATPSASDRDLAAYPDVYYVIVSLADSQADIRMYYYDGNDFTELDT